MRTEDGAIIDKCLNGDKAAFGLLVDKYKASIYALAYSRLRNFHDAEDVTQEVFITAFRKLRTLRWWDSFLPWLYAITSNLCKEWSLSRSRRPDREFLVDQSPVVQRQSSMNSYREGLLRESVQESLDSLPESYRQVLTFYYLGGMSTTEIARFLGTSPNNIAQRLRRARAKLKKEMIVAMAETYEQKRLNESFTFRVVEMAKQIKVEPVRRVPWVPLGLSVTAAIILTVLSSSLPLSSKEVLRGGSLAPTGGSFKSASRHTDTDGFPVSLYGQKDQESAAAYSMRRGASLEIGERLGQLESVIRHFIQRHESLQKQQQPLLEELKLQLAEIQQLRRQFENIRAGDDISSITEVSPARRDFVPAVPFEDRLKKYIELPGRRELQLVDNGSFEDGLAEWEIGYTPDAMNSTRTCEVVYDEEAGANVLEIKREGGGYQGSAVGLRQNVYIDLSEYEEVLLKLDVKPMFHSLPGGGEAGGPEYPVTIQVAFIDQRGEPHVWNSGFYYQGTSRYDNAIKVEQGKWFSYTSPNLKEIRPDCADERITADSLEWRKARHEYNPPVIPTYITRILVFGYGWDYVSRADNIEFVMTPRGEANSDE